MTDPNRTRRDPLALAMAWLVVLIPACWGVAQVVLKSAALFR
jgi:hypothetical protein